MTAAPAPFPAAILAHGIILARGVVEAINANIRAIIRRGRGYRDHEYLILKVQKSTAQVRLARAA